MGTTKPEGTPGNPHRSGSSAKKSSNAVPRSPPESCKPPARDWCAHRGESPDRDHHPNPVPVKKSPIFSWAITTRILRSPCLRAESHARARSRSMGVSGSGGAEGGPRPTPHPRRNRGRTQCPATTYPTNSNGDSPGAEPHGVTPPSQSDGRGRTHRSPASPSTTSSTAAAEEPSSRTRSSVRSSSCTRAATTTPPPCCCRCAARSCTE